jgi:hypothetical protein
MLAECIEYHNSRTGEIFESRLESSEVIEILSKVEGNNFITSIVAQFNKNNGLSSSQWYWAHKLAHEHNTIEPKKEVKEVLTFKLECNLEKWLRDAGLTRVMWKLDEKARVKLFINEDHIAIVHSGGDTARRVGKIEGNILKPQTNCPKTVIAQIMVLAKLKLEFMKLYGKEWGRCFVCGRELENEESVRNGIGPICAGKFG